MNDVVIWRNLCKKWKLAGCNFNALILIWNQYKSSQFNSRILAYNQPKTNAKTCRISTGKTSHVIYVYHAIKGITKCLRSKCQSNDSHTPHFWHFSGQIISKSKSQKFSSKDFSATAAFRRGHPVGGLLATNGCDPCSGILEWPGTCLSVDSACISMGIKCRTTLFRSRLFPLMRGTLTIAALIPPSWPGRSSSTFSSFQNALEVESFLRMTILMWPTRTREGLPFADFVVVLSRKFSQYLCLHCLANCSKSCLWCCCLLVEVMCVLIISKCSLSETKLILRKLIKWDGVSECEIDSSSP